MLRPRIGFTFAVGLLASACGPQVAIEEDIDTDGPPQGSSDDASAPSPSGSGPPPATTGPTPPPPGTSVGSVDEGDVDTGDGSSMESGSFVIEPDTCGIAPEGTSFHCSIVECDPFLQDCPEGEKCTPWANDGGSAWNSFRCSPVAADPGQVGDGCEVEGSGVSGIDDCDVGLMCFGVDEATLTGTCHALCSGSPEAPICPEDSFCAISSGSALALCFDTCDPIADDCAAGLCFPRYDAFVCIDVEPGGQPQGTACDFAQDCVAGTTCVAAEATGDCGGVGCCSSYCDLTAAEPDLECAPLHTCTPWFPPGEAPEAWTHVGICALPQ
jgi:hypothetical protein